MNEIVATRYLLTQGWQMDNDGWFHLKGQYDRPVCVETAYQLQKMMEMAVA